MTVYREINCKSACNRIGKNSALPYDWDLNVYRGCTNNCQYCFALYSHKFMDSSSFFGEVFVKTNIVDRLEEQLKKASWRQEIINLGGVTDNYQHVEAEYKIMPEILKLLIKYETPCIISSKSTLILRDLELIDKLSRITYVNIAQTITCADERVRQKLEPGGASTAERFGVLREFRKTNASIGVHLMPMVPYLSDSEENIEAIFSGARECGADYLLPCMMNLRGKTRRSFFDFLAAQYPELLVPMRTLYAKGRLDPTYRSDIFQIVRAMQSRYNMRPNYQSIIREKLAPIAKDGQLSFF